MTSKRHAPTGTAVVELAICLPIIFVIVFASIEACNMIALKQIVSETAYDGVLQAIRPEAEEGDILASIDAVLAARNVTPSNVAVEGQGGTGYSTLDHGDTVTVTIEANTNGNVVGPQLFGFAKTVSCTMTAIKQ